MQKHKNKPSTGFRGIIGITCGKILVPLTKKQKKATYWSRFLEIPTILLLWLMSKLNPYAEKVLAQKISKKWNFKSIPNLSGLSQQALEFKKLKTIEINKEIDAQTKIIDITTFNEIVETFPLTEIGTCGCRSIIRHCDSPKHTCMMMRWAVDISKRLPNQAQYQLSKLEELKKVINICDKYALVHMALSRPDKDTIYTICNCCDCCCISFREFLTYATPIIAGSKFVARIDSEKCKGCFYCINFRCRFRAILKVNEDGTIVDPKKEDKKRFKHKWPIWSERRNGWGRQIRKDPPSWNKVKIQHKGKWYAKVDPNRCFGCGNCASPEYGCPQGAIKLYPR
ncbi:MAG: hypothetical protein ACTSPD_07120 [Promethearchaeota archaeon]